MMNGVMRVSVKTWLLLGLFAVLSVAFWLSASPAIAHHTNCGEPYFPQVCDVRVSPQQVTWGNSITVSWTQRNQVRRSVILWRCLGYSSSPSCAETWIQEWEVSPSSSKTWTIPTCLRLAQYPGQFKVLVQVSDGTGRLADIALSNDQYPVYDLLIFAGPDPCLYSVSVNPTRVEHGRTQMVTWSSLNQRSYQLDLLNSSGQYVRTVVGRTYSTAQSRAWTVPADLAPGNYFIRVVIWNASGQSTSKQSSSFTVPNRAPVLDNGGDPSLTAINEDATGNNGTPVSAIIASAPPRDMITDADPNALEGLAIVAVNNSSGAWQYSANGGSSWTAFGSPSASAARLLDSDANTRVRFVPNPNFNGMVNPGITFRAWDQTSGSNGGTANTTTSGGDTAFSTATEMASITVNASNDPPSFNPGANQTINEDAGTQTIPNWATNIWAGPADESGQSLTFNLINDNNGLFAFQPAIAPDGTLTYQPAANANGRAIVTVWLRDNGGTANGGIDTSTPQTFIITINPVNDPPSFNRGADQTVDEDAGGQTILNWATNISAGPAAESGQSLTFNLINENNSLFAIQPAISRDGTLTYQSARNANGSATITVWLRDNGGTANGGIDTSPPQTFIITVNPVDDPPEPVDDAKKTLEDTPVTVAVLVNDSDPEGDPLNMVAVCAPSHGSATLNPDQTVTYTPTLDFNGSDPFCYEVSEGDLSSTATVYITVIPVNDPPSFNRGADQTVDEDAGWQTIPQWATNISSGPANESRQRLTFRMTNDNNSLFAGTAGQPAIAPDGTLTYQSAAGGKSSEIGPPISRLVRLMRVASSCASS